MQLLRQLYTSYFGEAPASIEALAGAGSNRAYYRLGNSDGETVIGVVGTSRDENDAFIYLSGHFR